MLVLGSAVALVNNIYGNYGLCLGLVYCTVRLRSYFLAAFVGVVGTIVLCSYRNAECIMCRFMSSITWTVL